MNISDKLILLIATTHKEGMPHGSGNSPSLGIIAVGTVLNDAGFKVVILDASLDSEFEAKFESYLSQELLFVGFSVMSTQLANSLELASRVKKYSSDIPVVFGGFHPTCMPDSTIANSDVDAIFVGQATSNIVSFSFALKNRTSFEAIPGVMLKIGGGGGIPLSDLDKDESVPRLNYDLMEKNSLERCIERGDVFGEGRRTIHILSGIGCKFKCAFCWNSIFKNPVRVMPAEQLYELIRAYKVNYNVQLVILNDEHFFGNKKRALDFIGLLEKNPLGVDLYTNFRTTDLNLYKSENGFLQRCYNVGFKRFGVGAESGSQRILNKLRKGITVNSIIKLAKEASKANIRCSFSFMACIPGETPEETLLTLQLIDTILGIEDRHAVVGPQIFRPYPGSSLYNEILPIAHKLNIDMESALFSAASQFRKIDMESLFWVDDKDKTILERMLRTYNVQSAQAVDEGLQSLLRWSPQGKVLARRLGEKITSKLLAYLVTIIKKDARFRIRKGLFKLYPEYRLIKYIDECYFID